MATTMGKSATFNGLGKGDQYQSTIQMNFRG